MYAVVQSQLDFPGGLLAALAMANPAPLPGCGDQVGQSSLDRDRRLAERANNGDRDAFDIIFREHVDAVYRRLTRLVGPDPEREDVVQEVFLAAFRGLGGYRGEATLSTWFYRIVVRVAYDHLRRRRRRSDSPGDAPALVEVVAAEDASPEAVAAQQQEVARALGLLDRLKPKKRIAFVLRVVEDLSLQEIGELVEASPAAVGQRVKHAHRELHRIIERQQRVGRTDERSVV